MYTLINLGEISLWGSSCSECLHNFTISWRLSIFLLFHLSTSKRKLLPILLRGKIHPCIWLKWQAWSRGHVVIYDFLRVLRLKPCSLYEKIFGFLDVEKMGKITFNQFLFGSAHVLNQPVFRQACESAFTDCCNAENLHISEQDLGDSIQLAILTLNQYEIHELFRLFDMNCDGRISKDDFTSCLRRYPLLIALFSPRLRQINSSQAACDRVV